MARKPITGPMLIEIAHDIWSYYTRQSEHDSNTDHTTTVINVLTRARLVIYSINSVQLWIKG